jgi:23S rRNA G2445 N2-methylase RlmL
MQTAAEFGVMRFHRNMRLQPDEAPIEIWLQQSGHELIAGLRLNTAEDRQHGGRQVNRAAALRPSIAASMVRTSGISDNDVFMDPMCGTGTLLLERAVMGRYELLLGGDSDRAAVNAAVANFGPRHKPRRIEVWDATALPIEVGSVDKVCTNLPWGRQIGNSFDLPELYRGVLRELARVVRPGGRIVIITSEWSLFKRIMREQPGLRLEATYSDIEVLGRRADIFQIVRA